MLHCGFNMHFIGNIVKLESLYGQDKKKIKQNLKNKHSEPTMCLLKITSSFHNWLVNLLPRELSKYYQYSTPQTCQRLLVVQGPCSWVNVKSLLSFPQGPVTMQLNPVELVKSLLMSSPGKLKRAVSSELHIWWPQASGFFWHRSDYTDFILLSPETVIPHSMSFIFVLGLIRCLKAGCSIVQWMNEPLNIVSSVLRYTSLLS